MSGLSLARFGHIAGGLSSGVNNFQRMQENELSMDERRQRMSLNDVQAQRQQKQWQEEDESQSALKTAREAGMKALEQDRQQFMQQQPNAQYTPTPKALIRIAQAETDQLFRMGRTDLGFDRWTKAEQVRDQMRGRAAQNLMGRLGAGGDITGALRDLDDTVDDGLDIESVTPTRTPDGRPAYEIRHRNRLSGKSIQQPTIATAQELEQRVVGLMADKKETAKYSLQAYLENFKSDLDRGEEDNKQRGRLALEAEQHRYAVQRIGATGAEARRTKTTPGADDGTFTLGEGQTRYAPGADGRPAPVASGAPKSGGANGTRAALVQERVATDRRISLLLQQMDQLAGPQGRQARPALDRELTEAKADAARIRADLGKLGGSSSGGAQPSSTAPHVPTPEAMRIRDAARAGRISRGEAIRRLQALGYE